MKEILYNKSEDTRKEDRKKTVSNCSENVDLIFLNKSAYVGTNSKQQRRKWVIYMGFFLKLSIRQMLVFDKLLLLHILNCFDECCVVFQKYIYTMKYVLN